MLTIIIPQLELFDNEKQEFYILDEVVLELEHSLVALSKWEQKYEKPYLDAKEKTTDEVLGYIEAMVLTPGFAPDVLYRLSEENLIAINDYINRKASATWFKEMPGAKQSTEAITSELIYYWMTVFHIPFEAENWHLNRLFNLVKVANIKNSPPKKKSLEQIRQENRDLNARRKAEYGTSG